MATSSPSINFTHTTDTTFRAWGNAVSTALQAVATKTTDTGQINWTTVTYTASASTAQGYEIYRFSDTLQATKPVFIKIEYGTHSSSTNPSIWVTVGTGTNGAGTLTGTVGTRVQSTGGTVAASSMTCYFAGGSDYLAFFIPTAVTIASGTTMLLFVVDRTRNADGSTNSDGLFVHRNIGNSSYYSATWDFALNVHTSATGSASFIAAPNQFSSGIYGTDTYVFPVYVFLPKAEAPAKVMVALFSADVTYGTTFTATHLGATHTFISLATAIIAMSGNANTNIGAAMIWE